MKLCKDIIKGAMMGIANIIPGVSGGTMAVSMGIYDDIIGAVNGLFHDFKKSMKTLLPYIIGMGIGLVGLSFVIQYLLEHYSLQTNLAFIGLILGGLPILLKRFKGHSLGMGQGIVFLIFFALIIGLQLIGEGDGVDATLTVSASSAIVLFFIGVIASATMVIPGVSGSMILMLLGYYNPILESVTEFIKAVFQLDIQLILHYCGILVPFGLGVVIGIFAIAKLIEILLSKYEVLTYSGILGLVIASPFAILMISGIPPLGFANVTTSVITFLIGFYIAFALGKE